MTTDNKTVITILFLKLLLDLKILCLFLFLFFKNIIFFTAKMTVVDRNGYGHGAGRGSTLYIYTESNRLEK